MKIYTRTGDDGTTGLFGGERVSKTDRRVEAYGTVDELNAVLGLARAFDPNSSVDAVLNELQTQLFVLGSWLARAPGASDKLKLEPLEPETITWLEAQIDELSLLLAPLRQFVLPTGSPRSAFLHQARTVCRRAERRVLTAIAASNDHDEPSERFHVLAITYLNRLSDLLFVLARHANHEAHLPDVLWQPRPRGASQA